MKWLYDQGFKQWYPEQLESGWLIERRDAEKDHYYKLTYNYFQTIGRFKKLKNAKLVAELIENG